MDTIEFVKQNGIEKVKQIVDIFPVSTLINIDGIGVSVSDLKQIIEAFDHVEYWGGIDNAKYNLTNTCLSASELLDLKMAVDLVEKCK